MKPEPQKAVPQPIPLPVLLVYGKPTLAGFPQAAWFRSEDRAVVVAAAQNLKYAIVEIKADTEQSLLEGVYEGVLKGSGRMIVSSVSSEVFGRIEAAHERLAAIAPSSDSEKTIEKGVKEQNMNLMVGAGALGSGLAPNSAMAAADKSQSVVTSPAAVGSPAPDPWRHLRVGSHVLAKFGESNGDPNGWWVAVVTDGSTNL